MAHGSFTTPTPGQAMPPARQCQPRDPTTMSCKTHILTAKREDPTCASRHEPVPSSSKDQQFKAASKSRNLPGKTLKESNDVAFKGKTAPDKRALNEHHTTIGSETRL